MGIQMALVACKYLGGTTFVKHKKKLCTIYKQLISLSPLCSGSNEVRVRLDTVAVNTVQLSLHTHI